MDSRLDAKPRDQILELLRHMATTAQADPAEAAHVRDALLESGILEVFQLTQSSNAAGAIDALDLLDAGGAPALRARLEQLTLADLRQVITAHNYDPERQTTRWRSPKKLIDLIVAKAQQQLDAEIRAEEAQTKTHAAASWML